MGNAEGKHCDDCPAEWEYKCKANVHFHCSKHYFERLKLGTLPHGGPAFWESRVGAVKLEPVPDFTQEARDSKVKMSSSIPPQIRSAVLKSTSQEQLQDRLRKAGVSVEAGVDKSKVQKAHDIIPKLREAIVSGSDESVNNLSKELLDVMPQKTVKKVASEEELLKQIEILEMLDDIVTNQELEDYNALLEYCTVEAVDQESGEAQLIHQYMRQNMSGNEQVIGAEVFRVARKDEQNNPRSKNQVLLWHGSKTASFVSILRHGLCLPKHATHGWLFGPGIYFADDTSKSLSYCSNWSDCLIALAEVNLGSMYPAFKFMNGPPAGFDSVWAVGGKWPTPATFVSGSSEHAPLMGCDIPMGRMSPVKCSSGTPCRHANEFIVYDTSRVCLRYLIRARIGRGSSSCTDSALFCSRDISPTESYLEFMQQLGAHKVMHWEYYLDRAQDGKSPGWHPYDDHLHEELEQRFADGEKSVDVRSGYHGFTYQVDFKEMKQTNLTHCNHTVRKIRRAEVDASAFTNVQVGPCVLQ